MPGEKLSPGERERIVGFLKENPTAAIRRVAVRFRRGEKLIRDIACEEGLTRKGKTGPAPGTQIAPLRSRERDECEARRKKEQQARMRFEDEPCIPAGDAFRRGWS